VDEGARDMKPERRHAERIVRFSLRFRGVIIALAVSSSVRLYTLARAPTTVFPEFALPQAVIQTRRPADTRTGGGLGDPTP